MDFKGVNPINSDPVTLNPRSVADLQLSSKAICIGVIEILVRL